jgi:hypothetical protein
MKLHITYYGLLAQVDTTRSISSANESTSFFIMFLFVLLGLMTFYLFRKIRGKALAPQKKAQIVQAQTGGINAQVVDEEMPTLISPQHSNAKPSTADGSAAGVNLAGTVATIQESIQPEKEEQTAVKIIGYEPMNIFAQSEPLFYPIVVMPKPGCVIKFPRKGRSGRKGYKEEEFKTYILKYFEDNFKVYDDRFMLVKNNSRPFEPDFTLIDERNGINIFLDIEIDEPYEGLQDIASRKATHYQHSDTSRDDAFKYRGWIVIRFAEIQVHRYPDSCCLFVADVIKSINPKFLISGKFEKIAQVVTIKQWTKEQAEQWSLEKYREKYLGIESFGTVLINPSVLVVDETKLGDAIEDQVHPTVPPKPSSRVQTTKGNPTRDLISHAISSNIFVAFKFDHSPVICKPLSLSESNLNAYCYIKNKERSFALGEITELNLKNQYYTLRIAGPVVGLNRIIEAVNTGISYKRHIRMKYTRSSWTSVEVDPETGELMLSTTEAEESVRTINNIQLSINALDKVHIQAYNLNSNYITAYCNKREEQRTFRFDRIGEIEILDV